MANEQKYWQRAKTTRRYIHPPRAERMFTLWADAKIIYGDIELNPGPKEKPYSEVICSGIWFVDENGNTADFTKTENFITDDGTPVHAIENNFGKIRANIEAISNIDRFATCYIKVTLKNPCSENISEKFGFVLRTGLEEKLVFGSPDLYLPYAPDINVWKEAKNTWTKENDTLFTDDDRFVCVNGASFDFDSKSGIAHANIELAAGEEKVFYMALGKGNCSEFDYETIKLESIRWWKNELDKINKLPTHITNDSEKVKTIRHLAAQILQCFCYPAGEDFLLARQGGLQRFIWPYESTFAIEALCRLGSYEDYIEEILSCYFNVLQTENGEIVPFGLHWAMASANVLSSFSTYCEIAGEEFYNKWREGAMRAFDWIKKTRASTADMKDCVPGLFPPLRSCDDAFVFQSFATTDLYNLYELKKFVNIVEKYNDSRAKEVREEFESYKVVAQRQFDILHKEAEGKDEIRHTAFAPEFKSDETLFSFQPSMYLYPTVLDVSDEDVEKIINFGKKRGHMAVNGLYTKMPDNRKRTPSNLIDADGQTRVWYTNLSEFHWFYVFMKMGDIARCEEIMDGMFKYSMTDELYMFERYHPREPYFLPWSPNASANGRYIQMLLDFKK